MEGTALHFADANVAVRALLAAVDAAGVTGPFGLVRNDVNGVVLEAPSGLPKAALEVLSRYAEDGGRGAPLTRD